MSPVLWQNLARSVTAMTSSVICPLYPGHLRGNTLLGKIAQPAFLAVLQRITRALDLDQAIVPRLLTQGDQVREAAPVLSRVEQDAFPDSQQMLPGHNPCHRLQQLLIEVPPINPTTAVRAVRAVGLEQFLGEVGLAQLHQP